MFFNYMWKFLLYWPQFFMPEIRESGSRQLGGNKKDENSENRNQFLISLEENQDVSSDGAKPTKVGGEVNYPE